MSNETKDPHEETPTRNWRKIILIASGGIISCCLGLLGIGLIQTEPLEVQATATSLAMDVDSEIIVSGLDSNNVEESEPTVSPTETQQPKSTPSATYTATSLPTKTSTIVTTKPSTATPSNTATSAPTKTSTPEPPTSTPTFTLTPSPTNTATPTQDLSICQADTLNCKDLSYQEAQNVLQMCMATSGDIHGLDENDNGVACEIDVDYSIAPPTSTPAPIPPTATPAPLPTATPIPVQPTEPPPPAAASIVVIAVDKRAEHVDIRNDGGVAQDLGGWNLISEKGNQECPLGGVIEPGQTLRIYALAADSGLGGFNCGHGKNIWNNSDPDAAVLYNSSGQEVSRR